MSQKMNNYIIDAYNFGFLIPDVVKHISENDFKNAIHIIAAYSRQRVPSGKVKLIFDGKYFNPEIPSSINHCQITFSKKPQLADDLIRNFIRKTKNINNWCVVSSDNEILRTAKDHKAKTLTSKQFLAKLSENKKSSHKSDSTEKPNNVDMDYWLRIFKEQ